MLAFARSLGDFGATLMVAGNIPGKTQTAAIAIYDATQAGRDNEALTLERIRDAEVVLLSFHVDYWDQLGWRDRFSSYDYTLRQQQYSALFAENDREVQDMICSHSQIFSRGILGFTDFTDEERVKWAPVRQRLVRKHPRTGELRRSAWIPSLV